MVEKKLQPSGPYLAHGIALSIFTSETLLGHVGDQDVLWRAPARISSPSTRIAVTIKGRSGKGSWSARASVARGTSMF